MKKLPDFSLTAYTKLLSLFIEHGYYFDRMDNILEENRRKKIFLRHDVDCHLNNISKIAKIEHELGISSTYYILVSGHYNILFEENRKILNTLIQLGHEIGLHYDLEHYPIDKSEWLSYLKWECSVLEKVISKSIKTICMHQPFKGEPDPFKSLSDYTHPHSPEIGEVLYVSDSCRAWRNEELLSCFKEKSPSKVLLNVHPELWLNGDVSDRIDYLSSVKMRMAKFSTDYIDKEVTEIWKTHEAVKMHDRRNK